MRLVTLLFPSLSAEEQRLIWSNRFSCPARLGHSPRGLPTLLLSLPHWHSSPLTDLRTLLGVWPCHEPSAGLELLDAQWVAMVTGALNQSLHHCQYCLLLFIFFSVILCIITIHVRIKKLHNFPGKSCSIFLPVCAFRRFADSRVRLKAVEWLSKLSCDDLCDFLPQLVQVQSPPNRGLLSSLCRDTVLSFSLSNNLHLISFPQSLRHDCYATSPMAELLLTRAVSSQRIAHHLYWYSP